MVTEGQTFTLTAAVSDDLDPAPTSPRVLSVTSDEAIDGTGDGHTSPEAACQQRLTMTQRYMHRTARATARSGCMIDERLD